MTFQQCNASIDFLDQAGFCRQLMNGSDASISDCLVPIIDIVADITPRRSRLNWLTDFKLWNSQKKNRLIWF
uniref:hypothetical protein n=1 Tax=Desulfosarcina alkanivorans TaxID=571177 RepID=UPI00142F1B40|nr:hypothetical protein [Desulfosarcina alkanivorans]